MLTFHLHLLQTERILVLLNEKGVVQEPSVLLKVKLNNEAVF